MGNVWPDPTVASWRNPYETNCPTRRIRAACGSTQQSPHEETTRKPFSDPPTTGNVWPDPTFASLTNPYENRFPTRRPRATCGPTQQSPHGETHTNTFSGQRVARPKSRLMEKPIRKQVSGPPTMGSLWLNPTVASWRNLYENRCSDPPTTSNAWPGPTIASRRNPYENRCPTRRPRATCGPTQQSLHGETQTKKVFRPADHGRRVARPNIRFIEKLIRKPFSGPPTMGGVWLDPTVASWGNPYENNCLTRQPRATCGPTQHSPHRETQTKTNVRPDDHGQDNDHRHQSA